LPSPRSFPNSIWPHSNLQPIWMSPLVFPWHYWPEGLLGP
jgi:hypothetical protein